ncbi:hypothetical protein MKW92_000871 [Papaver armeniacum]|nr:hypothetical protein MKW92_000871 [Papaver armeniacum]
MLGLHIICHLACFTSESNGIFVVIVRLFFSIFWVCSWQDSDEEIIPSDEDQVEADSSNAKTLTTAIINSWCEMVLGEKSLSVVSYLLNAYRVACQYGFRNASSRRIKNSEAFCKIVNFILREADNIFRTHLGISISDCETHTVLKLQNTQNWKDIKPLIRSYLSSTIKFLNQVTDSEIRAFVLTRLRASTIFFAGFPSLLQELIKTFIAKGKLGYTNSLHTKSRVDSLVKLYSLDVSRSCSKALVSINQLAKISEQGLLTKKKEAKQKIVSWQYINCVDLWVKFVCANAGDDKVRQLVTSIVQIIQAVAKLFPKPQHLPLRVKCVQMLNELSSSFGRLINVASLVLDCMEYMGTGNPDAESVKPFDMSFALKIPKQWVNSRLFQEECVLSAIELLSAHFAQWSDLTSFAKLAGFPLSRLRKFYEKITIESLRSRLESLIKMVYLPT